MPTLLLDKTDPSTLATVVEVAAGALCQFNFSCHNGQPAIIEGEKCDTPCDFCLAQAFYVVHRIVADQKEHANEQ